ncbi:MAG: NCS2 family permease [Oscillatoria sp. SIO1A7]|nr:NCS2 family permease [Oscillatoria sp. SIO1A7]
MSQRYPPTPPTPQPQPEVGFLGAIARFFQFEERQTNFLTEAIAGVTTFMTMAYILVANPGILSQAIFLETSGDLFSELAIATAIASAIATLIMALWANYPFALAPGMGLNAFFAFSVVLKMGIDWRVALAAVLCEGIIFILLTLSNIRSEIIKAIPLCLRQAIAAGIGLFLAYIALSSDPSSGGAGIIIADPTTKTTLAPFNQPSTLIAIAGILITSAFVARRIKGALLWGIFATAALGWIFGVAAAPTGIVAWPELPVDLAGQAFIGIGKLSAENIWDFLAIAFVFMFVDLFDTVGTLAGIGIQGGYINEKGELPRAREALMADAIGTTAGAILGTSTVTTYIESASGISEGGRTGFTAAIAALLFLGSIFFIPLLSAIPAFATAPALLMVGVLMMGNVRTIRWQDPAESIPSFLTILIMPLSFSIAEGLAIGFIAYPLIKTFQGKAGEIASAVWVLAFVFLLRFVWIAMRG